MAPRNVRALLTGAREAFMDTRLTALEETEKPIDIGAELAWLRGGQQIAHANPVAAFDHRNRGFELMRGVWEPKGTWADFLAAMLAKHRHSRT